MDRGARFHINQSPFPKEEEMTTAKSHRDYFALHFGYMTPELHKQLSDHYDHICSQLTIMMSQSNKWTPRTND